MKSSFDKISRKAKRDLSTYKIMSEKSTVFEDMDFADAQTRVPNEKPPLRFAPEKTNLNETNMMEFALKDDMKAFLDGQENPQKKNAFQLKYS